MTSAHALPRRQPSRSASPARSSAAVAVNPTCGRSHLRPIPLAADPTCGRSHSPPIPLTADPTCGRSHSPPIPLAGTLALPCLSAVSHWWVRAHRRAAMPCACWMSYVARMSYVVCCTSHQSHTVRCMPLYVACHWVLQAMLWCMAMHADAVHARAHSPACRGSPRGY